MRPAALDEPALRRYLLGMLPEVEAVALEQRYFSDPETFEQVWAAENDLVDDYVAGRLGAGERRLFTERYLASPRHRERVAAAAALRSSVAGASRARVSRARPAILYLALAASLLLALAAVWRGRPQPSEAPLASLPATSAPGPVSSSSPTPQPRPPIVAAFAISPISVRSGDDRPALRIPSGTDQVLLHLEGAPVRAGRLRFALRTVEGRDLASGLAHPPAAGRAGRVAAVRLPAARLAPGDYILTLSARGEREPAHEYFFRVAR
jgi:hypothetical protein